MKTIQPTPSNYDITDSPDSIKIVTKASGIDPGTKTGGIIGIVILFFTGATFLAPVTIFWGVLPPIVAFLPLILWVGLVAFWIIALLFRIKFQEKILVSNESIIVEYQVFIFKPSYKYLATHIKNLRASPLHPPSLWAGRMVFDYGGQTIYIGSRITEGEAKQILLTIQNKFSQYDVAK